jgi:hypothetical protein
VAGPGVVLDAIRLTAQGWLRKPARLLCARWLIAFRQPVERRWGLDLGGDDVDQPVENLVLALDIVSERSRSWQP